MGRARIIKYADMPEEATKIIVSKKIQVRKRLKSLKKPKYSKEHHSLYLTEGYDLVRLQLIVRPFFCKKNKIQLQFLELMLFLYPMQFFAQADYARLPKMYNYKNITKMINDGHFIIAVAGTSYRNHVYALSRPTRKLVEDYYKYLSGEKTMPYDPLKNPLVNSEAKGIAMKRDKIIKYLSRQPLEPMKKYFQ